MHKTMATAGNADHEFCCTPHAVLHFPEAPHASSFMDANPPPSIHHTIQTSNAFLTTIVADLGCSSRMSKEQESFNSQSNTTDSSSVASHDDGSVAGRLLSSITRSMPSASLQLANCKEVLRETPFQKSLKLKRMALQHCAEAIGMESSNSASPSSACANIISQNAEPEDQNTIQNPSPHQFVVLPIVGLHEQKSLAPMKSSSADRGASFSKVDRHYPKYSRSASFPPPLSYTLPSSSSCESLSISLHPLRKDGRLILQEVMAPSKHYFHAHRQDGRLTLHMLLRDTEEEEVFYGHCNKEEISRDMHDVEDADELEHITTEKSSIISQVALSRHEDVEAGHGTVQIAASKTAYSVEEEAPMMKASRARLQFQKADHFAESPDTGADMVLSTRLGIATSPCLMSFVKSTGSLAEAINFQCCIISTGNHHCSKPMREDVKTNIDTTALALSRRAIFRDPEFTMQNPELLNLRSLYTCAPSNGNTCALNRFGLYFPSGYHDMATFVESKDSIIWDTNLVPCKAAHQNPKARLGQGKIVTHRFVVEVLEQYANTIMTKVARVKDCNTWPLGSKPLSEHSTTMTRANWSSVLSASSVKNGPIYSALDGVVMDKKINVEECVSDFTHNSSALCKARPSHLVGLVHDQQKAASICCAVQESPLPSLNYSTCALVHPAAPYHVQGDEWPSHLNCKEPPVYHRNHFGVCSFMKPNSCIATIS